MTMSIREAFDRGTKAFNAHDLEAFGELMSDDVIQTAPGGLRFEGKAAALEFHGVWLETFPDCRQTRGLTGRAAQPRAARIDRRTAGGEPTLTGVGTASNGDRARLRRPCDVRRGSTPTAGR